MRFIKASVRKSRWGARKGDRAPRRRPRLKHLLAGLLVLMVISQLLPLTASDVPDIPVPSVTYGVNDDLAAFQAEKNTRYNPPEVLRETRNVLDTIQPLRVEKTGPNVNYTLVQPQAPDYAAPGIFNDAENNTGLNGTSIIQFLLEQPLSYWVYTNLNGLKSWTKGFLRPTLDFDIANLTFLDLERWVPVDADRDPATGNADGNEVQARISLVLENQSFTPPQLSPVPPFISNWSLNFSGGLRLEVGRLAGTTAHLPMEVAFLKAFMYRGLNYVWMISFNFSDLPLQYSTAIVAEKVRAGGSLRDIIPRILGLGNNTNLADVSGPYKIQMFTSPLESVQGIVGYAKAVNLRLEERSWVKLGLGAAEGSSSLPGQMEVWLDSPSFASSFNHLRWTSSGSVRFDAEIVENQENTTYANISMHDVPDFMELRLDNTSTDGTPKGYVRFSSSRPLALVEYNEYEVYGGNPADFTLMHARISGMPTSLTLTGTFDVARSTPPSISNPVGIGFIAKLLDNTMVRLSSKFYTIARTLRSIPDNLLHMPERAGWTSLDIPSDQHIGAVELWLASGPYIVRDGAFLAFYNLTLPPSGAPLMGVSFSARLEGIAGLQADFRRGNHIDLRTTVRQRFTAVFVDSNRDANASLEINPLPSRLVIDVDKDNRTLTLFTSDKVLSIEYLGWVGRQFLKVALSDLPTTVTVVQKANQFYINASEGQVVGAIDILSTNADLYVLEGNYLLVKSWAEGTSFGASLHGLGSVGYSTGPDGKLDLSLSSPDPLQIYIENESEELKARILINPLPSSISIGMSNLLGGGLKVPDIMNATSVFGFSSAVFAITDVGADVLNIASQVAGYVDEQMSGIGQNSTFSIRTASDTTLVGDIQKGNLTEAPWTHGITTRHIPAPVKGGSYYNTKLYLRLARETTLVSKNDGDRLNISIELRGFHPKYDWMLFDLRGMAGRDMFAYLTGIPSTVDLWLDANLTQNTTYGRELLRADLRFVASKPLGPFLASIARNPPVNSRVLLFASSLSPDLHIEAFLAERFELRYRATEEVRYLYIKTSRLVSEKWRSSTVLLHDIPRTVDVSMNPPTDFDAAAAPSHVLPEFSASADRDTLDIFVDFDGRASGQRSSFQIAIRDCGELITARRSGDTYRLRSSGSEEVYVKVREMPYRKEFSITALALYAENLHGLDLQISMVSGSYPIFRISDLGADSVHLGVRSRLSLGGDREGRLMLADCRSSGGIPSGIQLFSNGITSGSSTNDDHLIIPMPLASMLWTLFGG